MHQIASQISKFSGGDTPGPRPRSLGRDGTPLPRPLLRSALRASMVPMHKQTAG